MSNKLRQMGSASSGRKEENMFLVFAYLNTQGNFDPMLLRERVKVTPKTIESYLKQIQEAQMLTSAYQMRMKRPFEEQWYSSMAGLQLDHAQYQHELALKRLEKLKNKPTETKQQLMQFQFADTIYKSKEELYQRLEQALLVFTYINAPKGRKQKAK